MYNETYDDLNKRYNASYVLYKGELAWVRGFEPDPNDDTGIKFHFETRDGKTVSPQLYKSGDIELLMFDSHFFNTTTFKEKTRFPLAAVKFVRTAKRQNKRSLSNETGYLASTFLDIQKKFSPLHPKYKFPSWGLDTIHHMLNPVYLSYPETIEKLNDYMCIALSPNFAISLSTISSDKYLIQSLFGYVAEATDSEIIVRHQPAFQELVDYVSRSNTKLRVVLEEYNA